MVKQKTSTKISVRVPITVKRELEKRGVISEIVREAILTYLRYEELLKKLNEYNEKIGGERP